MDKMYGRKIFNRKGELIWQFPDNVEVPAGNFQEHVELVTAIGTGQYLKDSDDHIRSNSLAIVGRISAYTGREITWDEVLHSDLRLGPDTYEFKNFTELLVD